MVEIFKTNVNDPNQAKRLIEQIHATFPDYHANFDLEDCDKILRVQCNSGLIASPMLKMLIHDWGFQAEVLPGDVTTVSDVPVLNEIH